MHRKFLTNIALFSCLFTGFATQSRAEVNQVNIWPEGTLGVDSTKPAEFLEKRPGVVKRVYCPKMSVYPAKAVKGANGAAMIICPGGGYAVQAAQHEGHDVAKYYSERGVTCFVLQYRLPSKQTGEFLHPVPVSDALRAIQYVRFHAKKHGIDSSKIGILGFSAGGHLTGSAATLYNKHVIGTDEISKVSARPDFAVLVYPVITSLKKYQHRCINALLPTKSTEEDLQAISCERNVTKDTPPCFFVHAKDDKGVVPENSILMHEALKKAGVKTSLNLYEKGGHGFGLGRKNQDSSKWPAALTAWFEGMQLVKKLDANNQPAINK